MTNAIFNFQSQAGAIPVFSRKYINTGSHLGFHSDWVDWARTKPFWSADMPLQARGKDRFIFLGGIFKKTGDISRGFLPLLSFKMLGSRKKNVDNFF